MMDKITSTMVLALLKKGLSYEVKGCETEMEVPLSAFGFDEDSNKSMKISMKVESAIMKITED